MRCSIHDAWLLLRKWRNAGCEVVALVQVASVVARCCGNIESLDENPRSILLRDSAGPPAIIADIGECKFSFSDRAHMGEEKALARFLPPNWDLLLVLRFSSGIRIILFAE